MSTKAMQVKDASARYSVKAEAQDVPPGYKQTEVGVIPEDWDIKQLSDVCTPEGIVRGPFGGALKKEIFVSTGFKVYEQRNAIYKSCEVGSYFVDQTKYAEMRRFSISPGNFIISCSGTIGRIYQIPRDAPQGIINQALLMLTTDEGSVHDRYFYILFEWDDFQAKIIDRTQGGAMKNLVGMDVFKTTPVVLPPLLEQSTIAEALSDVDGFLAALDKLIAKKRAIKQATMQQLLTGKTRLPGFSGEWETKRLGEIGAFSKGRGIKRDDVSYDGVPCIRYGELYTRYHNYVTTLVSHVSPAVARTALPIKTGDVLFAGSGETAEEIGSCVAYLGEEQAFAGGDIVVLTPSGQDSIYLGHLMNHPLVSMQKVRFGQGDAVVHISARNLAQVEINLPPVEEQSAIATVLSDMDAEIAALERRRDKTKHIKQGMMQQLLTGRVRLVKPEVAAEQAELESNATKAHSWAINEAVVIAVLAKQFGSEAFPLGRMRYTKLSYLLHRHAETQAEGYMKKAAGPYNPKTRYGGPENIAVKNGYIREHTNGKFRGFVASGDIAEAESYFEKWYGPEPRQWLEQFRYKKNDELELLATVDMAVEELRAAHKDVSVEGVKDVIRTHPEWQAKLDRPIFSDANTAQAIETCQALFGQAPKSPV